MTLKYEYINEELPYNKELASQIGIDYANDGKSIRIDPIRVEVESWTVEHRDVHECSNPNQWDCRRCASNQGYDSEFIEIRVLKNNKSFGFVRHKSHRLGGCWSNWYDDSYSIAPVEE